MAEAERDLASDVTGEHEPEREQGGSGAGGAGAPEGAAGAQHIAMAWRRQFRQLTGDECTDARGGIDPERLMAWQRAHGLQPTGKIRRAELDAARARRQDQGAHENGASQHAASQTDEREAEGGGHEQADEEKKKKKWRTGAPHNHAEAHARHQANLQSLKALLEEHKDGKDNKWGKKLSNAAQWLLAGKTQLHALTETHDSTARAAALGKSSKKAYFGIDVAVPTMSDYNAANLADATNVDPRSPGELGFRRAGSPSKIAILDPVTRDKKLVEETIVHEVQHDADHHPLDSWNRYKSEFNAYWIDRSFDPKSKRTGTADPALATGDGTLLSGFDNARQQYIFRHLYDGYSYVPTAWTSDPTFKANVLALKAPEGTNLIDSVRIDDLYLELTKSPPNIVEAKKKLEKLTGHDRAAILDPAMADPWRRVIHALPDAADRAYFTNGLQL